MVTLGEDLSVTIDKRQNDDDVETWDSSFGKWRQAILFHALIGIKWLQQGDLANLRWVNETWKPYCALSTIVNERWLTNNNVIRVSFSNRPMTLLVDGAHDSCHIILWVGVTWFFLPFRPVDRPFSFILLSLLKQSIHVFFGLLLPFYSSFHIYIHNFYKNVDFIDKKLCLILKFWIV